MSKVVNKEEPVGVKAGKPKNEAMSLAFKACLKEKKSKAPRKS